VGGPYLKILKSSVVLSFNMYEDGTLSEPRGWALWPNFELFEIKFEVTFLVLHCSGPY
jgi:hypothetical protein